MEKFSGRIQDLSKWASTKSLLSGWVLIRTKAGMYIFMNIVSVKIRLVSEINLWKVGVGGMLIFRG